MRKEVGSKLASSVRQAKAKQPNPVTNVAKASSAPAETLVEVQAAPPVLSSKRVWPD